MDRTLGDEANTTLEGHIYAQYSELPSHEKVKRSHEGKYVSYLITFKPFNINYDPTYDAIHHVRRKVERQLNQDEGYELIITREIMAKKIHYHCLVITKNKLLAYLLHGSQTNKYKIDCQQCEYSDKYKIHDYIVKEIHSRHFVNLIDIYVK